MSLLALELNEQRLREVALDTMRALRASRSTDMSDEQAWPSPAPKLVAAPALAAAHDSDDFVELAA
jgi:hypothetical protein